MADYTSKDLVDTTLALGRAFKVTAPEILFSKAKLVFIGRIKTVRPSKITTRLSYPTWKDVRFRWLMTDIEVLEPLKGVRNGESVRAAMLSIDKDKEGDTPYPAMPPGLLEPEKGDVFLLCLAPTPLTNVFAALRAPWDEDLSVFALNRARPTQYGLTDVHKGVLARDERFAALFSLTDRNGQLVPAAVERVREVYATELTTSPADIVIYLEWETYTNLSGWMSDAPRGYATMTNLNKNK